MADVLQFHSNARALIGRIREIVKDSSRVSLALAVEKGIAGSVTMSQIWKCLEEGDISFGPVTNEHGHTLCNLTYMTAGQEITLAIGVEGEQLTNQKIYVMHISEG